MTGRQDRRTLIECRHGRLSLRDQLRVGVLFIFGVDLDVIPSVEGKDVVVIEQIS